MKFIDFIFCDDIRYELNNKLSIMGLYNDKIILHTNQSNEIKWPIPINLAALFRFRVEKKENCPDHFEFEYTLNDKSIVKINGEFNPDLKNENQLTLAVTGTGVPLEPGDLGFSIILLQGNKNLLSKREKRAIKIIID